MLCYKTCKSEHLRVGNERNAWWEALFGKTKTDSISIIMTPPTIPTMRVNATRLASAHTSSQYIGMQMNLRRKGAKPTAK